MSQPEISIIVPVHNAGIYFEKCLSSLVNQTLREIEIILVLDCPTDGSDKVAETYAAKDSRIKLIYNEENLHTGLSRNKGLKAARGKYIGFHDHDDYCEPNMYELLYKKAEEGDFEITRCNFTCIYGAENSREDYIYPDASTDISIKEWIYAAVCGDIISCVIWNHIYRADFLAKNNILFLDSRAICSEDSIFFIEVYSRAKNLGIVPDYLYYHVFHSSNTGKAYPYRSVKNRISFFEGLYSFLQKNDVSEEKSLSYMAENVVRSLYSGSRQALLLFPLKKAIGEIRHIRRNKLMMKNIKYLYRKDNHALRYRMKPTVIAFSFIIKTIPEERKLNNS